VPTAFVPGESLREQQLTDPRVGVHDSYLQALDSGGLIGVVLLFAPLPVLYWRMIRRSEHPLIPVVLPLATFSLVFAAFNVVMENLYLGFWVWLPLIIGAKVTSSKTVPPVIPGQVGLE
jgi:O-antigen ligase